jgi:hypothetical protein
MHVFRRYNGKDNASHVREGTLTLDRRTDVSAAHFKESPPHSAFDWHDAPEEYYVITLAGTPTNTGHAIAALAIDAFMPVAEFKRAID